MKKRTLLLFLALFVFACLYFAPKLLQHKHFQDRVTKELITTFGTDCRFSSIRWHWLPIPALYVENFKSESEQFTLTIPKVQIVLRPQSFFDNTSILGRLKFIEPHLHLQTIPSADTLGSTRQLPDFKFSIANGSIELPQIPDVLGSEISLDPLLVTHLNMKMAISKNRLKFSGNFKSNLSKKVETIGRIDLGKHYYRLDLDAQEATLAPLINQANKNLQIANSSISLHAHLEGLGPDNFKFNLSEITDPISFTALGQEYTVQSIGNIALTKHTNEFFVEFDHFDFADPAARFTGKVSKRSGESPDAAPVWTLDISGSELDLASIRNRILSLWPANHAATTTCSIVRGGKAKTARYVFKGPATDFNSLKNMKIWAEAVNVPLYLSDLALDIDRASGPITIINGYLAGKHLTADIGTTHGENASLWLDLIEQDDAFYLEIDLDADLQDIQDVLGTTIHQPQFQSELEQFSEIAGRAKGKLTLGSALHSLDTTVQITYLSATGFYERLPWPFKLDCRKLDILPGKVIWEDMQSEIGEQTIHKTSGTVRWNNETTIDISQLDATLNLGSFFDEAFLQAQGKKSYFRNSLSEVLSGITGSIDFSNTKFSGPALSPEKWSFDTSFTLSETTIQSPYLPPGIVSEIVQGTLSSDQVSFSGIFKTFDQNIFMSGQYQHSLLDNWSGKLELNGPVKHDLGEWLRTTGWIPELWFPRLPLTLNNLQISNSPSFDSFQLTGEIIAHQNQAEPKTLRVDISHQKDITLNNLLFTDNNSSGAFSYILHPKMNQSVLTWKGTLDMETLDLFFERNIFHSGVLNGVFSRLSSPKNHGQAMYSGYLEANDLTWNYQPDSVPITAHTIRLNGEDNAIHFEEFSGRINDESLQASGTLTHTNETFKVEGSVRAKSLTLNRVINVYNEHRQFFKEAFADQKTEADPSERKASQFIDLFTGKIDFTFDHLNYIKQPANEAADNLPSKLPKTYTWNNAYGNIFLNSGDIKLQFFPSDICGMEMSATYFNRARKKESFFDIVSGQEELNFEEVLPCLGQETNIIKGPFKIKGHLDGFPGNWQNGTINVSAEDGIIKRMNLLSNIFSVINFTDLFTWGEAPDLDGKGLMYSRFTIKSHIEENSLALDSAVLKGKGINLTGRGTINLADNDFNSDLTFFVAPFKLLDTVVTNVPLIGKAIGGEKESILTFPVSVSGPLDSPKVQALPAKAVGTAALEFIIDTLTLPIRIFVPDLNGDSSVKPVPKKPLEE